MGLPESFPMYADRFLEATAYMDAVEVGMYVRVLLYQWKHGYVPTDEVQLQRITGVSGARFTIHWRAIKDKFCENGVGLVNHRMECVRDHAVSVSDKRAAAASKRGRKDAKHKRPARAGFKKPTVEEVRAYIEEKGYAVDADEFWNFYESKGWKIGKNAMKNWKAAVVTWTRKRGKRRPEAGELF